MRYLAHGFARAEHSVHIPQLAGIAVAPTILMSPIDMDWYRSVEKAQRQLVLGRMLDFVSQVGVGNGAFRQRRCGDATRHVGNHDLGRAGPTGTRKIQTAL
jgi:hypothetical protein